MGRVSKRTRHCRAAAALPKRVRDTASSESDDGVYGSFDPSSCATVNSNKKPRNKTFAEAEADQARRTGVKKTLATATKDCMPIQIPVQLGSHSHAVFDEIDACDIEDNWYTCCLCFSRRAQRCGQVSSVRCSRQNGNGRGQCLHKSALSVITPALTLVPVLF